MVPMIVRIKAKYVPNEYLMLVHFIKISVYVDTSCYLAYSKHQSELNAFKVFGRIIQHCRRVGDPNL